MLVTPPYPSDLDRVPAHWESQSWVGKGKSLSGLRVQEFPSSLHASSLAAFAQEEACG